MNRLQFATLLSWADEEGIQGRKRLQKVVFMLQQAGCDLNCHYILHHYGPYSRDVADTCDEMVAAGLIEESQRMGGIQYRYKLAPRTIELLKKSSPDTRLKAFQSKWISLLKEDLWTLELGSTILYFYQKNSDWNDAMQKACNFKKKQPETPPNKKALEFAKRMTPSPAVKS